MKKEIDIWNEGRRELTLRKKDGSVEKVVVKKVGIINMQDYMEASANLVTKALFCVEREEFTSLEWFESLEEESQFALVEKEQEINDPLFARWLTLKKKREEAMGINHQKMETKIVDQTAALLAERLEHLVTSYVPSLSEGTEKATS